MRIHNRLLIGAATVFAFAATTAATFGPAATSWAAPGRDDEDTAQVSDDVQQVAAAANTVHLHLTPSSQALAQCMPNADVNVTVKLTTDKKGFDIFDIQARHIAPNRDYTVFLLQFAGAPFGAAEYIGDLSTNAQGNGHAEFRLIVQEAFSSTIVDGKRTRVDLNQVGMWFADPADDEFCLPGSGATPFDGDNEAGVQAFNSATATPLPAP
jgi:hypothetical protein